MYTLFGSDSRPLPDVAPFLRAIRDQPAEDTHRLVLADFLQERGDAERGDEDHAHLIRIQCEQRRRGAYTPGWWGCAARGAELLDRNRRRFTAHPGLRWVRYSRFDRGLPSTVHARRPGDLRRAGPALEAFPIDGLLLDSVPDAAVLARRPELSRMRRLGLTGCRRGGLDELLWSRAAAGVEGWYFGPGGVPAGGLDALRSAVSAGRARCSEVVIRDPFRTPDTGSVLGLARLLADGRLDLGASVTGPTFVRELVRVPEVRLAALGLGWTRCADAEAAALAGWAGARTIRVLNLASNGVTDAGLLALARSPHFGNLAALSLSRTSDPDGGTVTDAGAAELAGLADLPPLGLLDLRGTGVGERGRAALAYRLPNCDVLVGPKPDLCPSLDAVGEPFGHGSP